MSPTHVRRRLLTLAAAATTGVGALTAAAVAAPATALLPQAVQAPDSGLATADAPTYDCVTPQPVVKYRSYHCQTPQDMRDAFHLTAASPKGDGQTIVLVDAYGSPTAAADLQKFHDTFFPTEPAPHFDQVTPLGSPDYAHANCGANGQSGPAGADGWAGEAELDVEWAYAVAPHAHIVLLATPPAETLGVQGFPNLFKAISDAIDTYPSGTVFSMSFGVGEETFGGAAKVQTARFDQVFAKGQAKGDTFLSSAGDSGSTDVAKQHRGSVLVDHPSVSWPNSSPYVTSVGGTELMYGWTWAPTDANPLASTDSGTTEAVWNEPYFGIATGGGVSTIYPRPSYQKNIAGFDDSYGNHRLVPDLSFPAAVNGGPLVYTSFFPGCNRVGWHLYGGTSASSPQVAGLVALTDQARTADDRQPIGDLNAAIYSLATKLGPTSLSGSSFDTRTPFRDIVAHSFNGVSLADNAIPGSGIAGYLTQPGYDLTTGWGSPLGQQFIDALNQ